MNKSPIYLISEGHTLTTFDNREEARSFILKQKVKRWEKRIEILEQTLPTLRRKPERLSCEASRRYLIRDIEGFNQEIDSLNNKLKEQHHGLPRWKHKEA